MRVEEGPSVHGQTGEWLPKDCLLRQGFVGSEKGQDTNLGFSRGIGGGEILQVRGRGRITANVVRSYRHFRKVHRAGQPTPFLREGGEREREGWTTSARGPGKASRRGERWVWGEMEDGGKVRW